MISEVRILQIAREVMAESRHNHPVLCAFREERDPEKSGSLVRIRFEDEYPDIQIAFEPEHTEEIIRNSIRRQVTARQVYFMG